MPAHFARFAPALLLCVLPFTACGSDDGDGSDQGATGQQEPAERTNPVDVLKKIEGCVIEPGVTVGEQDMNGNLYAECEIPVESKPGDSWIHSISVLVRSVGQDPATLDESYEDDDSDDTTRIIFGPDFYANVGTDDAEIMAEFDIEELAEQIGGEVQPLS